MKTNTWIPKQWAFKLNLGLISLLLFSSCFQQEAEAIYKKAMQAWDQGQYEEATQNFIAVARFHAHQPLADDALFWTASIYDLYLNEPSNAIRYYESLQKNYRESPYTLRTIDNLVRIYKNGNRDQQYRALELERRKRTLLIDPINVSQSLYEQAKLHLKLQQNDLGRIMLKKLISEHPDSNLIAPSYALIGYSFYSEQQYELAKLAFKAAYQNDNEAVPMDNLTATVRLADFYEDQGQLKQAINYYQEAITNTNNNSNAALLLNQVLLDRKKRIQQRLQRTN